MALKQEKLRSVGGIWRVRDQDCLEHLYYIYEIGDLGGWGWWYCSMRFGFRKIGDSGWFGTLVLYLSIKFYILYAVLLPYTIYNTLNKK